ncbi:right-handed parallel beta-helix repeat-containing protein [Tsuneonella dongtanensis]|uniref:right-handed parallel beta-helix repeat-containing protein n=1 Tax=Tsuneonella dongtanensis TaxID=692370 RepID=UPI000836EE06|nr:right-handed parallel beta-helix repeat-containing protein [Tsuneonella dongtanensis]
MSRSQPGAGIATTATAIVSGDTSGHWTIGNGRLYPSAAGDTANMNAGPYVLGLDNGDTINVTIEPDTWDAADYTEFDFLARQAAATIRGKTIALRNSVAFPLQVTGTFSSLFRRLDLRDPANGNRPTTVKGRFGAAGDYASYCEISGTTSITCMGLTIKHLRTTPVAEPKFSMIGSATYNVQDITIEDCWVTGAVGDPNGDYSASSNYPNFGKDLINTTGSVTNAVGSITVRDCLIEWGASCINIAVSKAGHQSTIVGNEVRYFYDDAIGVSLRGDPQPSTIAGNFIHDSVGHKDDSASPHPDAIRLIANTTAAADWPGIVIEDNVILQGTARGAMQCIYLDDFKSLAGTDSGRFFVATIRNNVAAGNSSIHGLTIAQAKDCLVERNTVVSWNRASSVEPSILVGPASTTFGTSGGGNIVRNNIADAIYPALAGVTLTANHEAGLNGGTIAYSTLMDGPTWAPTSVAEAFAVFAPKVDAGATAP